ncbi:MAG: RNA-guided endonuclease InsQ/TnpB family protein [Candidatus Hodarchaeales archaeon]
MTVNITNRVTRSDIFGQIYVQDYFDYMVLQIFKPLDNRMFGMQRTIQCSLPPDNDLVETIKSYNKAVQHVIDIGWSIQTFNKNILHSETYSDLRKSYPGLQSSLVQCARDMASGMLKREKFKSKKPFKRLLSGVRYNQRTFTPFLKSKLISISTIAGRKKYPLVIPSYFHQYLEGRITSLTLRYNPRRMKTIAYLTLELPDIPVEDPSSFLGVDRGIKRVAVCSNNSFYSTNHILAVKWKYQQLRQELQSKGTRSTRRKLRAISGRERRFMTDENRKIAKWICNMTYNCIVLENIRGLNQDSKKKKKVSKYLRKRFGNWSYFQLEQFIIERAEKIGKLVLFVNPRYTSQRCSQCGYTAKKNRATQSSFLCGICFNKLNADLNAARNLSDFGKAEIGRASVNSPNVAVLPLTLTILSLTRGTVLATNH